MKEQYDGEVFGCMGCVSGDSHILFRMKRNICDHDEIVSGKDTFESLWKRLSKTFEVKEQIPGNKDYLYMDLNDFWVWDTKKGFVEVQRMIRNTSEEWVRVETDNGFVLHCTKDHPFTLENRGDVTADDLVDSFDKITTADISDDAHGKWYETLDKWLAENGILDDTNTLDFYKEAAKVSNTVATIKSVQEYHKKDFSYDLTTASEHFEVNNIYSHNCRSFLGPWKDPDTGRYKWEGRLTSTVGPTLNDVNARKSGVITFSYC